ncbi:MAG: PfkB family carbohydrate kinase [Verrucomicrobiota bacterium]
MSASRPAVVSIVGSLSINYHFKVDSLPAIGETVAADRLDVLRGGKGGNEAIAVARQGCVAHLFGAVGNDEPGLTYRTALKDEGVKIDHLNAINSKTGTSVITRDPQGNETIVSVGGANDYLARDDVRKGARVIEGSHALLGQFEVTSGPLIEAADLANRSGTPVIFHASPFRPAFPFGDVKVDHVIASFAEALELLEFDPLVEGESATRQRLHEMRIDTLLVTRGAKDTLVYERTAGLFSVPTLPVLPIDTTGASDAFAGCFAARIAQREPLEDAVKAANCAGALVCLGRGAQDPIADRDKVDQHREQLNAQTV